MSDGPTCIPFEMNFAHSKLLYNDSAQELLNSTEYGRLWSNARSLYSKEMKQLLNLSDDNSSFEIGIQVIQSHFTFILKFYMYDDVSKD